MIKQTKNHQNRSMFFVLVLFLVHHCSSRVNHDITLPVRSKTEDYIIKIEGENTSFSISFLLIEFVIKN